MIKFIVGGNDINGPKTLGIGLSFKNLELLKSGKPIIFSAKEIFYGAIKQINSADEFFIFADETEEKMMSELSGKFDLKKGYFKDFRVTKCSACGQESVNQRPGDGCHSCSRGIMKQKETL